MNTTPEQLARQFINRTGRNLYLTGRAGTGKTTFLREIRETTKKKMMVAAPTGVAAINAGGVTLHSLFQLPFGTYLPSMDVRLPPSMQSEVNNARTLMRNLFLHNNKRRLLQELELLIIDEVSMLRPDILDAIDRILQVVRRRRGIPFGGVQLLLIGDLLQLPPVVNDEEWLMLQHFYKSPYFFESLALQEAPPVYLEFETIYRQTDQRFIELLNNVRDNRVTESDRELLNSCYQPGFSPEKKNGYIYLTTHNRIADHINREALENLRGRGLRYEAEIQKDFGENLFPIGDELELKEGAQVMFIKNDPSGEGRFFNGKIGTVVSLDAEEIEVGFNDGSDPVMVEKYTWYHKRYKLGDEDEIKEEIKGTFTQYPLKLAWAVTIHKSQGLTFDKAIIDVERAFAPGQVYVALSRLSTMKGLVLSSKIPRGGFDIDPRITAFAESREPIEVLLEILEKDARIYFGELLKQCFNFRDLVEAFVYHLGSYNKDAKRSAKQRYKGRVDAIHSMVSAEEVTAARFRKELTGLLNKGTDVDPEYLKERIMAAGNYYEPRLRKVTRAIRDIREELEDAIGVKGFMKELRELESRVHTHIRRMHRAAAMVKEAAGT